MRKIGTALGSYLVAQISTPIVHQKKI